MPKRQDPGSAGFTLYSTEAMRLLPHRKEFLDLGIAIETPPGTIAKIDALRKHEQQGLSILGGTIDADYRGNILVMIENNTDQIINIKEHDAIAQLIFIKIDQDDLQEREQHIRYAETLQKISSKSQEASH